MKVLVFTDEYDFSYFTFVYNEIKYLKEAGIHVSVICDRLGKLESHDMDFECIALTPNKVLRKIFLQAYKRKWNRILGLFPYYQRRRKIIQQFKPDLIHFHFGDTAVRLFFPLKKVIDNIPTLISFHGFDASSLLNKNQYTSRLLEFSNLNNFKAICASNHLRNNLIRSHININSNNSYTLYYGIDLQKFNRTKKPLNNKKIFLQISSFFEKKGHIYTFKAFQKFIIKNPYKAKLVIGGNGPSMSEFKNLVNELNLQDDVEFIGWVTRENAVRFMEQADYFVHHSITTSSGDQEGLPNALIEAMAMELPVISTYHSGIPELVENGVNGFLIKEKDIESYAQKMEEMLDWSYLKINREKIINHFSLKSHTEQLIQIYSSNLTTTT